jgi:hypothetical protein
MILFPASPVLNEIYTDTTGNRWQWDGFGWNNLGRELIIKHEDTTERDALNSHTGEAVSLDATGFTKNLDGTIVNSQLFADKFDQMDFGQVILDYIVPESVVAINLTTDKDGNAFNFGHGEGFAIYTDITFDSDGSSEHNEIRLRFNSNIGATVYHSITTSIGAQFLLGTTYYKRWRCYLQCMMVGTDVNIDYSARFITNTDTSAQITVGMATFGLGANVSQFNFVLATATKPIKAGSRIIITRIR